MAQLLQSKQKSIFGKKRFKALVIFLLVVVAIVMIGYGYQLKINYDINQVGRHVVILLEDRYHKKFAIQSGCYEWNIKTYEFVAYPKDNLMWLHYIGQHLLSRLKTNLGDLSNE